MLGRGERVRLGGVGDDDPALGGGLDVDVVDPGPGAPDHLQPVGTLDQPGVELGGRADQDRVELADAPAELAAIPLEAELDVEALLQELDAGVGDRLLHQDLRLLVHAN